MTTLVDELRQIARDYGMTQIARRELVIWVDDRGRIHSSCKQDELVFAYDNPCGTSPGEVLGMFGSHWEVEEVDGDGRVYIAYLGSD